MKIYSLWSFDIFFELYSRTSIRDVIGKWVVQSIDWISNLGAESIEKSGSLYNQKIFPNSQISEKFPRIFKLCSYQNIQKK